MTTPAIEIRSLRKRFSVHVRVMTKRVALDGLDLTVEQGSIFGFLGPNGAGKTTTIKVLTSLLHQDSGDARIFGKSPLDLDARRRLGYLPETPSFYEHLTGREFLRFCGALSGLQGAALHKRADELLERVGLAQAANLHIRRYSKGMTQRIGIAQALIGSPDLVILDEPMSGLDPMGRGDVRDLILELKRQGKTIFFSTHIIPDVEVICDRVGVIAKGKLVRDGTVGGLLAEGANGAAEVVVQGLPEGFAFGEAKPDVSAGRWLFHVDKPEVVSRLLAEAIKAGGTVVSVTPRRASLEELVVGILDQSER